ncbi:MAG: hypothetical protein ACFFFG_09760, partial [Candidatus Thorarchaeota archaeon]
MSISKVNPILNLLLLSIVLLMPLVGYIYLTDSSQWKQDELPVQEIKIHRLCNLNSSILNDLGTDDRDSNTESPLKEERMIDTNIPPAADNYDQISGINRRKVIITAPTDDPRTVPAADSSEVNITRLTEEIEVSGNDIVINETTVWQDLNLVVNSSIIVNSSVFRLINTTLTFNCTISSWGIATIGNGELYLVNSSVKSISGPSLLIANSSSLVNSTRSNLELFRGENTSACTGTGTNITAILLRDNATIRLNESRIGYLKALNNATVLIAKATELNEIKILGSTSLVSNSSFLDRVNLFDYSRMNSSFDQILRLSKTATVYSDDNVTGSNLITFITQNVDISSSTVVDTRTNIFLGRNRTIWLSNLSAAFHRIDWVYGDNTSVVNSLNSTIPLEGIISLQLNLTDSNITIVKNSILGDTYLLDSDCIIDNTSIILIGNLTIQTGGNITITRSTMGIKSDYDGDLHIEVLNGGEMNVMANSTIFPFNESFNYGFWVKTGSTFHMMKSHLEGSGYSLPSIISGLWVNSSKEFIFENNTIISNYYGLVLENMSNTNITRNVVIGGRTGIVVNNSNRIRIQSNTLQNIGSPSQSPGIGILMTRSSDCIVSGNDFLNITGGMGVNGGDFESGKNGGIGAGVYLTDSDTNIISNNRLFNVSGGEGGRGGDSGSGGIGGIAAGIYLNNSRNNVLSYNIHGNITGGVGGTGGDFAPGGTGGIGTGIYLNYSDNNKIGPDTIANITGGRGGAAGDAGIDGGGGLSTSVFISESSNNINAYVVTTLTGGLGNPNGSQEYIHFNGGFNNSWAYETTEQVHYSENQTVYFGLDNFPSNDTQLLYYRVNLGNWEAIDVTTGQNFTFTEDILSHGLWNWYFWFNDTEGFQNESPLLNFTVINDGPLTYSNLNQTSSTPEYDENNTVSITIEEPTNGSKVDTILLYYRVDMSSWISVNVTSSSNYTFSGAILEYNQSYDWYFWFNDTTANIYQSSIMSFTVTDHSAPNYTGLSQTSNAPEYDENNTVSVTVTEPSDASGVDAILLFYEWEGGPGMWIDVTGTSNYTFSEAFLEYEQVYTWFFWFNDTEGNSDQTVNSSFTVGDTTAPTFSDVNQTSATPEYDDNNTVSVVVTEPDDASGVEVILLYYTIDNISWTPIDVTSTSNYTFSESFLSFNQSIVWYFGFLDFVGNFARTPNNSFIVIDATAPYYSSPTQVSSSPEYNENNTVSITVTEPGDASGVDTVLLYYKKDSDPWVVMNVTDTGNFTFSESMLEYGFNFTWYFWFNDSVGNYGFTGNKSFIVVDTTVPGYSGLIQSNPTPEYNGTNVVSITVIESVDASGVDSIWLYYQLNGGSLISVNVTNTSNFTFTASMLQYGQTYDWYFWFNDTAGNTGQTPINTFTVLDNTSPSYSGLSQTNPSPQYDETNTVSITVGEPADASGIDSIWLYYQLDGGSLISVNVTDTSNFTFTASMLQYGQIYDWYFWFNDTAGNVNQTPIDSFTVLDTSVPTYSNLIQTNPSPQYDEANTVSITVGEPADASGIDSIWLYYQLNGGSLISVNVTDTSNFTFTASMLQYGQIYDWYFWFNDTAGNINQTPTNSFSVVDATAPTYSGPSQTNPSPQYDETNIVSITVGEPVDASGVASIWLHYQVDGGSLITVNVTDTSSYTFSAGLLQYGQTYDWYFWFNDTAGNVNQTPVDSFTIIDATAPTYSGPSQTNPSPQYDETNIVSITVG